MNDYKSSRSRTRTCDPEILERALEGQPTGKSQRSAGVLPRFTTEARPKGTLNPQRIRNFRIALAGLAVAALAGACLGKATEPKPKLCTTVDTVQAPIVSTVGDTVGYWPIVVKFTLPCSTLDSLRRGDG